MPSLVVLGLENVIPVFFLSIHLAFFFIAFDVIDSWLVVIKSDLVVNKSDRNAFYAKNPGNKAQDVLFPRREELDNHFRLACHQGTPLMSRSNMVRNMGTSYSFGLPLSG